MVEYVSLELADKLVKRGAPLEAKEWSSRLSGKDEKGRFTNVPAYSIGQMLDWLPSELDSWITIIRTKPGNGFRLLHRDIPYKNNRPDFDGVSLPDALAQMILYLFEQGWKFQEGKLIKS